MTITRIKLSILALVVMGICGACSRDGFMTGIDYVNQPAQKDAFNIDRYTLPDHIVVRPVAGIPREVSDVLAELTAEALISREFIATVTPPKPRTSRLTGWANPPEDSPTQTAFIEFRLSNPDGQLRHQIDVPVELELFSALELTGMERRSLLKRTAAATADRLYAIITESDYRNQDNKREVAQQRALASTDRQSLLNPTGLQLRISLDPVYVMPALGAPGDGINALPKAMSETLAAYSVPVSQKPKAATLQLQCIVAVTDLGSAQQSINISWELKSPTGDIVATVDQSNSIEGGSLDGAWGDTAYFIASAAAEGLVRTINDLDPSTLR